MLFSLVTAIALVTLTPTHGRSLDKNYERFVLENLPTLIDELREYELEQAYPQYPDDILEQYLEPYDQEDLPSPRAVPGWPQAKLGQIGGVGVDKNGSVYVFHRGKRVWDSSLFNDQRVFLNAEKVGPIQENTILKLDPASGAVVHSFGGGKFFVPHGLTVDHLGNIWVTDVGLHQVMRFPAGAQEPDLVLGEKLVPGSDDTHFCQPTDVAVASNGDFFVSDGYCNSRVLKFANDGTLLDKWGDKTGQSSNFDFNIPHSLALMEKKDRICVADRQHGRIQCFNAGLNDGNQTGSFERSFTPNYGSIFAIAYDPNSDLLYAVNGAGGAGVNFIGGLTLDKDGNVVETWAPNNQPMGQPHDVAVSPDGADLYVGTIAFPGKVWKFIRRAIV